MNPTRSNKLPEKLKKVITTKRISALAYANSEDFGLFDRKTLLMVLSKISKKMIVAVTKDNRAKIAHFEPAAMNKVN